MKKLKDLLTAEMKAVFGGDTRRIKHALNVMRFAEDILAKEAANVRVVIAAAVLHDIGIHECERKYSSTAGKYQEIEGPAIAAEILDKISFPPQKRKGVLEIIAHHHSGGIDSPEFRVIWDADRLVNFPEEISAEDTERRKEIIEKTFRTSAGRKLAERLYS